MAKLAIQGGPAIRAKPAPETITLGEEEKQAAMEVLESGRLSQFTATDGPSFLGGQRVRSLETAWQEYLGVKHAVAMNSATSGLYAAIGAGGIEPGDEVIVTPYSMIASASCALVYQAIPVFSDIDALTFTLDPASIERRLTPLTKAIVVVHLFGQPADMDPIMAIARDRGILVVEDCAQAPGASYKGRPVGTIGHMGVFSYNVHKTIQCGEGGIVVTNDDELALRLQLIRNHGEVIVGPMGYENIVNILGFNYRMTELEAAIAEQQLRKLEPLTYHRIELANYLTSRLFGFPGITTPTVDHDRRHVYYLYCMKYNEAVVGVPRDRFVEAVQAEGVDLRGGYVRPIYWEPQYQRRIVFGTKGAPFSGSAYRGKVSYEKGLCPVAERVEGELISTRECRYPLSKTHIDEFVAALEKVYDQRSWLGNRRELD